MPRDMYIRRDRSSLASGTIFRGKPRRTGSVLLVLCGLGLMGVAFIYWQLDTIQPAVWNALGFGGTATPTPLELARQGDLAYNRGDLDASVDYYRRAADLMPDNVDISYELIRMLIYRSYSDDRDTHDIQEAKRRADALAQAEPNNERALAISCYADTRSQQYETATQTCNRAVALAADDADAYAYLAQVLLEQGRLDAASDAARKALAINPNHIEGNTALAFILVSLRRAPDALDYLTKATQLNPRLEYPYYNLAAIALSVGLSRGDEATEQIAIKAYDTILSLNKRSVKAYTSLCRTYLALGERNLGKDNCQTATGLDSSYSPAWRWLGELHYGSSEYAEAIQAFNECVSTEKNIPATDRQPECWVYGGLAYVQSGNCPSALPLFDDVLDWTSSTKMIDLVNKGIRICTGVTVQMMTPTPPK